MSLSRLGDRLSTGSRKFAKVLGVRSRSSSRLASQPDTIITHVQAATIPVSPPQESGTPRSQGSIPDPALKIAIERYVKELPEDDRNAFESAKDVLDEIRMIDQTHSQASSSRSFGTRISKVLQLINKFLGSVAICIQHSPAISSLVVGGLHCVLSLVLGYIEFFEKLTTMMEQIAGHLDYLSQYGTLVFQNSPEVQNVRSPRLSTRCVWDEKSKERTGSKAQVRGGNALPQIDMEDI
ncbi:hypothetical protein K440DRAFT_636958 [Wilcoxina mikolae CBS 423.85]|nr:hypothetical protein K440DRAFT_636958 [Wilcoxina mikolae CBS 423.85]